MALFRGHMLRISAFVVVIILGAYKLVNRMQYSMHTFNMTQTSIAIIGLATVMLLTVTHNRRQGGFLTPTQEELLLASSFALFWFSAFIAYRVFGQRGLAAGHGVESIHHDWHERTIHPVASSVLHPNDYGYNRGWDKDHRPGQRPPQRAGMPTERPGNYEGFNWPCPSDAARCIVEEWYY